MRELVEVLVKMLVDDPSAVSVRKTERNEGVLLEIKVAKEDADNRVERSLYNRAVGYTFKSEKIVTVSRGANMGSDIERVPIKEHVPPDVTAQIFWLKNRRKDQWRDRVENTHAGPDGGPIQTADMTDYEKARQIAFALKAAHRGKAKTDPSV